MKMKRMAAVGSRTVLEQWGYSLVEIMVALSLIGLAIVPMLKAFRPAIDSIDVEEEMAVFSHQAKATLCRVAALDFDTADNNQGDPVDLAILFGSAAEAAKESFSFRGQSNTPVVAITDASGGAGGLLRLSVAVGDVKLTTLKANY
jgi:prepilin-type N-terminal cleavage/methylation domain-containing protein